MGNARVFNSVMMGGLAQLVGGDADVWRSVIADRVAPKVRDLNVRAEPHVLGPSHLETAFAARGCGVP